MLRACIAVLACLCFAPLARANSVQFVFSGTITGLDDPEFLPNINVGDALSVTITLNGNIPITGDKYVNSATAYLIAVNGNTYRYDPALMQDPPAVSRMQLDANTLAFSVLDELVGPTGSMTVDGNFPLTWFADIHSPLPVPGTIMKFGATGNIVASTNTNASGVIRATITQGEIIAAPLPNAAFLGFGLIGAIGLAHRRASKPS